MVLMATVPAFEAVACPVLLRLVFAKRTSLRCIPSVHKLNRYTAPLTFVLQELLQLVERQSVKPLVHLCTVFDTVPHPNQVFHHYDWVFELLDPTDSITESLWQKSFVAFSSFPLSLSRMLHFSASFNRFILVKYSFLLSFNLL